MLRIGGQKSLRRPEPTFGCLFRTEKVWFLNRKINGLASKNSMRGVTARACVQSTAASTRSCASDYMLVLFHVSLGLYWGDKSSRSGVRSHCVHVNIGYRSLLTLFLKYVCLSPSLWMSVVCRVILLPGFYVHQLDCSGYLRRRAWSSLCCSDWGFELPICVYSYCHSLNDDLLHWPTSRLFERNHIPDLFSFCSLHSSVLSLSSSFSSPLFPLLALSLFPP